MPVLRRAAVEELHVRGHMVRMGSVGMYLMTCLDVHAINLRF